MTSMPPPLAALRSMVAHRHGEKEGRRQPPLSALGRSDFLPLFERGHSLLGFADRANAEDHHLGALASRETLAILRDQMAQALRRFVHSITMPDPERFALICLKCCGFCQ